MKARGIVSIIIGIVLLLLGIAILCALMFGFDFSAWKGAGLVNRNDFITVKQETVTQPIAKIETYWIDGSLEIFPTEDEAVRIIQKGKEGIDEGKLFEIVLDGDSLKIKDRRGGFFLSLLRTPSDLQICLPQRQYEAVTLKTVSADIQTIPLDAKRLDISTTSGNIKTAATATTSAIRSVSGDIQAQNFMADNCDISTTSGNVAVEGNSQKLTAHSVSGDIKLDVITQKLTVRSTSGRVTASGSMESVEAGTVSGEIEIASAKLPSNLSASSTSGNIALAFPEGEGFSVHFSTTSGTFGSELPMTENQKVHQYGEGGARYEGKTVSGNMNIKKIL